MPLPQAFAGQVVTPAFLDGNLQSSYRDELMCPGIAETQPRWTVNGAVIPTSGTLYLAPVYLIAGLTISNFTWVNTGTAASGPTHQWCGLYDAAYNQLAVTADRTTTAIAGNTQFTWGVATTAAGAASSFITTYSGLHYVGWMVSVSTTMPQPFGVAASGIINAIAPAFGPSDTGQGAPPAFPHTAATPTSATVPHPYMYLT